MNVRKSGIAANMSIGLHQTWVRSQDLSGLLWLCFLLPNDPHLFLYSTMWEQRTPSCIPLAAGRLLNRAERLYEPRHQVKMCDETKFLLQVVQLWKFSSSAQ